MKPWHLQANTNSHGVHIPELWINIQHKRGNLGYCNNNVLVQEIATISILLLQMFKNVLARVQKSDSLTYRTTATHRSGCCNCEDAELDM
jgi:hypothetical protein